MVKLKAFLSRHLLWLGILAVVTALLLIFFLQYRSLVTIEATLPVYRKEMMKKYLGEITKEVVDFYVATAEQALNVPAATITHREDGVIPMSRSGCGSCQVLAAVEHVADYFKQQSLKGVKRYFVVVMASDNESLFARVAFVYNPALQKMELAGEAIEPKRAAPEFIAIHSASAPVMSSIRASKSIIPQITGYDRDPEYRILIRPIVDEAQRMIGVAGLVLDQAVFKQEYLPSLIERTLPKYLPEGYRNAAVTVVDEQNRDVFSTQPGQGLKPEVQIPFDLIYTDWRLGIGMRQMTEEQWMRRTFLINLSLWTVMTVLLVGGVALTLRAASREMKVSQMKTDFVSNVSHELRTPLASIRVFGEFLKLGRVKDTDKVREYGAYIETESRRLTQLINNILDFSRIESGQKSYHFELADVGEIVAETFRTFEVLLKQSDFQITFEAPSTPLPQVLADPDAIMQAFVNLLDNAVKYSGPEREIGVRLGRKNNWVMIAVTDRGIGIPEEDQEKIFERFHRVSTGLVHDVKGTGLGLSIVKHIIEAHHGQITVESKPGCGSTFTIYLPVEESLQIKPGSHPTSLAVDDNSVAGAGS